MLLLLFRVQVQRFRIKQTINPTSFLNVPFLPCQVYNRAAEEPLRERQGTVLASATPAEVTGGGDGTTQVQLTRQYQRLRLLVTLQLLGVMSGAPALLAWLQVPAGHRLHGRWREAATAALVAAACAIRCASGTRSSDHVASRGASRWLRHAAGLRCPSYVMMCTSLVLAASHVWGLVSCCTLLSWGIAIVTLATLPAVLECTSE